MTGQNKNTVAIILAVMIIARSFFNIFFPGIRLRESVGAFFSRQMDILAVMGGNISKEGIQSAVSEAFVSLQKDKINTVS